VQTNRATSGTVARALQLARSGSCVFLEVLRKKLKKEGYALIIDHLNGPSLK
jgi:hypothetical protein